MRLLGAIPVLVDVDPHSWNLDPERVASACRPATKAVIASHLHGGVVPMRDVMAFAREHGLQVIEDAAQMPGAVIQGRKAGTWGDVGVLSFGGSKLLTAGPGNETNPVFSPEPRKIILFWSVALFISLLLAFGRFAPFYQIAYALPYFSTIRNPGKFLHIVTFAALFLFAYGLDGLCRQFISATATASCSSARSMRT